MGGEGSPPFPSVCEREELMWDEHIRLFIQPVYFQPSGFMVIGKALPSRSFPEGVNISPSPSFLPLCLFFSNSIFSQKKARNAHTRCVTLHNAMPTVITDKLSSHFLPSRHMIPRYSSVAY